MIATKFGHAQLAAALARGVEQCVVIGSRQRLEDALSSLAHLTVQVFAVGEGQAPPSPSHFIPTHFASETLADAMAKSAFDNQKPSLFLWLGGTGYRTYESVIASFAFIASLPKGSGILFDYVVERTSIASRTQTALDTLASRISLAGGHLKYLVQPQAVLALLRGLGYAEIVDLVPEEPRLSPHLVSAFV